MFIKTQLIINHDPKQILILLFCIVSPPLKIFFPSCKQKMTLISVCFHSIMIKPLKNFICLYFKFFNFKINIFAAGVRCSVISVTCYVHWFSSKKSSHVNIEKSELSIELWVPQKVFLAIYCILYQPSPVVFYLRQTCESSLDSLCRAII